MKGRVALFALFLIGFILSSTFETCTAQMITSSYKPFLYADRKAVPTEMYVFGGKKDKVWYPFRSLPITVDGQKVAPSNAKALSDKPCKTPLLKGDEDFVLFDKDGAVGVASIKGIRYEYYEDNGAEYIVASTKNSPKLKGLTIGVNGDWNAVPRKTTRSLKNGVLTFKADIDGNGTADDIAISHKYGDDTKVYQSKITYNNSNFSGPVFVFDDGWMSAKEEFEGKQGFFVDVDGDGRLEFLLGSALFRVGTSSAQRIAYLDFSEP